MEEKGEVLTLYRHKHYKFKGPYKQHNDLDELKTWKDARILLVNPASQSEAMWFLIQDVPRRSPNVSWDRLQPPHNPVKDKWLRMVNEKGECWISKRSWLWVQYSLLRWILCIYYSLE